MEFLERTLREYGYFATGIGCFLEGETILLVAAFLANHGYLRLEWVILVAAVGAFLGDIVTYLLGIWKAEMIIHKVGLVRRHLPKAQRFLARYGALSIFLMRFSYGLRATTGIVCGVLGMAPAKFVILAAASCALWATIIGVAGYLFGHATEGLLRHVQHYEKIIVIALIAVSFLIWIIRNLPRRKNNA